VNKRTGVVRCVRIVCATRHHCFVEDASGIASIRCTGKACRIDGKAVIHYFDLATGECQTVPEILRDDGERPSLEGLDHGLRSTAL
jgi:hypothetical protein